jgi:Sir2 family
MDRAGPQSIVVVCGALCELPAPATEDPAARFDAQRIACAVLLPTPTHEALARLQQVMGHGHCLLATTAVDGLLHKASAEDILEIGGSLFRLACVAHPDHPRIPIAGRQQRAMRCVACGAPLATDVGGGPLHLDSIEHQLRSADLLLLVSVEGPLAGRLTEAARALGVRTFGAGNVYAPVDRHVLGLPDDAIPGLVGEWLAAGAYSQATSL